VQLQVGVEARGDAPEGLEDRPLAPRHRRVRLLDAQHPPGHVAGQLDARLGHERHVADPAALADRLEQPRGDGGVPQPVVDDAVVEVADHDVLQVPADLLAAGQVQLVVLHGRVVGEAHREQEVVERRLPVGHQGGAPRHHDGRDGAALGREPPLLRQPVDEQVLQGGHGVPSGGVIESQ
jgi:hypothetical protein